MVDMEREDRCVVCVCVKSYLVCVFLRTWACPNGAPPCLLYRVYAYLSVRLKHVCMMPCAPPIRGMFEDEINVARDWVEMPENQV